MRAFLLSAFVVLIPNVAVAVALDLSGDQYWAVLASKQDPDEAIAFAQNQSEAKVLVVHAANGSYAAISGPHTVEPGTARRFLEDLVKAHGAPKGTYFTQGAAFDRIEWTRPQTHVEETLQYDGVHPASLRKGDLDIKVSREPIGDGQFAAVATGRYQGRPAFRMVIGRDNSAEKPAAQVALVRLDPDSPIPQVVFTYFWQGAHCCTVTRIATLLKDGSWHVVDGEALDGDGGYTFADLQNKGFSYLVSIDQSFLYAFDSYAGSFSATEIHQLVGDRLLDVTKEPRFHHVLLQDFDGETQTADGASKDDDTWHTNGFLAGWVASALLVGRGEEAWAKMLKNYDRHSDFGPQRCTIAKPIDDCPDNKRVAIPFPVALRQFLTEHGYISDPDRFKASE